MSEIHDEIVFDAVPPEEVVFNPDRVRELHGYVTTRLEFFHVPDIFEHDDKPTDDEVRGLISLYVLTSDDKHPTRAMEGKALETREEFVARTVLIPMLTEPATDEKIYRKIYRDLAYPMSQLYKERLEDQWSITHSKQLFREEYTAFIRSTGQKIALKIAKNQFETTQITDEEIESKFAQNAKAKAAPVKREPVRGVLKPETEGMTETVKLVRGLFEAAMLNADEAAIVYRMLSRSENNAKLQSAAPEALQKLRDMYYEILIDNTDLLNKNEQKRIHTFVLIKNPQSLYDQIFEARRNGEANPYVIEQELIGGLQKILDAHNMSEARRTLKRMQRQSS